MTSRAGAPPAGPRGLNRTGIVAVEKISASWVGRDVLSLDSVDNYQKRGAVGVLTAVSEPDRLRSGIPVASRAMGQEGGLPISP